MVIETGFDSDVMQMEIDEAIVFDNDMVQVATEQEEEIYLSDNENDEFGEIYFSDEEDNDDTYEDGRKEADEQLNCGIKDTESVMLPLLENIVKELEEVDEQPGDDVMLQNFAALPFADMDVQYSTEKVDEQPGDNKMLLNFAALPFIEVDFQYPTYDYGHSPEP